MGKYILIAFWALVVLSIVIPTMVDRIEKVTDDNKIKEEELKDYKAFQNETEVIKGQVKEAKKENHLIFPDDYNLTVKITDDDIKMLSVSEQEYRTYQAGSNVHFRIDKTNNNSILRDLKNESDIDTLKAYKEYNENSPRHLFK